MGTRVRRQRERKLRRWLLAAGVVVATTLGTATPARADSAFTLTASAVGASVVLYNQGFPLVQSIQVNTPSARAMLNSRGQGSGYSAAPDPGQDVAELPTTGSAQLCGILAQQRINLPGCSVFAAAIPPYPYAYAQSGDPPQDKSFAAAHLHAEATDTMAEAQTIVGGSGVGSAVSTARTSVADDGSTDTSGIASVKSLEIGTYLQLTGINATAVAHRDSQGHLSLSSSFQIAHLTVHGLELGFQDGSFVIKNRVVPVPVPIQQVLSMLKRAGITATFLPETRSATGITSEGLMLSYDIPGAPSGLVPPIPLPLPIGVGVPSTPTTVTYVLGRADVTSTNQAIPGFDDGLIGVPPGPNTLPSVGTPTIPVPSSGIGSLGGPATGPGVVPPTTGPSAPAVAAPRRTAFTSDSTDIYLAIVVVALALFGGATAIRFLGVRLSWTS